MEHLVRLRYWWFMLSGLIILPGLYFLLIHPLITTGQFQIGLRPSIDFSGGTLREIYFQDQKIGVLNTGDIARIFAEHGFEGANVQLSEIEITVDEQKVSIPAAFVRTKSLSSDNPSAEQDVLNALRTKYGAVTRERTESVGPTVSQESTRSAVFAVAGASIIILLYLTWAFRQAPHPIRYGVCAILAMLHDAFLVLIASNMGTFFGLEVDALFLTALLTILSFSVHDTIVVFDRVRENLITRKMGQTFDSIVNHSLVQTLSRSINTQLTTAFTLTSLLLFGGSSIRNFVAILLIGLISGTYSSIFNAAQFLVVWEHREWETWFKRDTQPSAISG